MCRHRLYTFEIVSIVYFESLKNSLQYLKAQINAYGQYIAHIYNLPTFQETQKHQGRLSYILNKVEMFLVFDSLIEVVCKPLNVV